MKQKGLSDVEKRFSERMIEGLPVKKRWLESPQYRKVLRDQMKSVAYHEAGHFTAKFFTRFELSHIYSLSIIPNKETVGRMSLERSLAEVLLDKYPPPLQRTNGFMLLLHYFSGFRAEMILENSEEQTGLDYWWEDPSEENESSDIQRAIRIADIMSRPYMPRRRILSLADKWTEEMLTIPAVWNVVVTVSKILISKGEISHEKIMDLADSLDIPSINTIPKWTRRFLCRREEIEPYIERDTKG
jgi:hypothetical protein